MNLPQIGQTIARHAKKINVKEILADISSPGMLLIFMDDTGTPDAMPTLPKGSQFICGVTIASATYAGVDAEISTKLRELNVTEFHATEIVNPGRHSHWRGIDVAKRSDALDFLFQRLLANCIAIYFCPICPESLDAIRPDIRPENLRQKPLRSLLWLAAINAMIIECREYADGRLAIVRDREKNNDGDLHTQFVGNGLYGKSIIHAKSEETAGLQLADLAAYALVRSHRSVLRAGNAKANYFDSLILNYFQKIRESGNLVNVLDLSSCGLALKGLTSC